MRCLLSCVEMNFLQAPLGHRPSEVGENCEPSPHPLLPTLHTTPDAHLGLPWDSKKRCGQPGALECPLFMPSPASRALYTCRRWTPGKEVRRDWGAQSQEDLGGPKVRQSDCPEVRQSESPPHPLLNNCFPSTHLSFAPLSYSDYCS